MLNLSGGKDEDKKEESLQGLNKELVMNQQQTRQGTEKMPKNNAKETEDMSLYEQCLIDTALRLKE